MNFFCGMKEKISIKIVAQLFLRFAVNKCFCSQNFLYLLVAFDFSAQ